MPDTAFIHSVLVDSEGINVYALVNTEHKKESIKKFIVAYTGQPLPDNFYFLGTGRIGNFVFHVFQIFNQ